VLLRLFLLKNFASVCSVLDADLNPSDIRLLRVVPTACATAWTVPTSKNVPAHLVACLIRNTGYG